MVSIPMLQRNPDVLSLFMFFGAQYHDFGQRAGTKAGQAVFRLRWFSKALSVGFLAPLVVAILCFYQTIAILPVVAGDYFPGKGSREVWTHATLICVEADHLEKLSKFSEAIAKYKAAIAMYPYDADYYTNLGYTYRKREAKGDPILAEAAYRKSILLKPNLWNPWYGLANVLFDQKRHLEAKSALSRAMSLRPPDDVLQTMRENIKQLDRYLAAATP